MRFLCALPLVLIGCSEPGSSGSGRAGSTAEPVTYDFITRLTYPANGGAAAGAGSESDFRLQFDGTGSPTPSAVSGDQTGLLVVTLGGAASASVYSPLPSLDLEDGLRQSACITIRLLPTSGTFVTVGGPKTATELAAPEQATQGEAGFTIVSDGAVDHIVGRSAKSNNGFLIAPRPQAWADVSLELGPTGLRVIATGAKPTAVGFGSDRIGTIRLGIDGRYAKDARTATFDRVVFAEGPCAVPTEVKPL